MASETTQRYFLLVLIIAAGVLAFYIFRPFLAPLALAAIFAVVLQPIYQYIRRALRGWNSIASLATVFVSVVCLVFPLTLIVVHVAQEAQQLFGSIEAGAGATSVFTVIDRTVGRSIPGAENVRAKISDNIGAYTREAAQWLLSHMASAFASIATAILDFFVFVIALYYLLRDGAHFKRALMRLSPLASSDEERIFEQLANAVNSVVRGNLLVALIQGVLTGIGFTIFGIPNSILWGSATFFAAMIPGVGTALVIIPAVLYLFFIGKIGSAIGLAIWGALAVGTIDNFLGPKVVSSGLKLHPLVVLPAVLGGVAFFGPVGIFLGPLSLSFLFALLSVYSTHYKRDL